MLLAAEIAVWRAKFRRNDTTVQDVRDWIEMNTVWCLTDHLEHFV